MSGPPDQLRLSLAGWWGDRLLPTVDRLTDQQAREILARIDELHWECRPFHPDEA